MTISAEVKSRESHKAVLLCDLDPWTFFTVTHGDRVIPGGTLGLKTAMDGLRVIVISDRSSGPQELSFMQMSDKTNVVPMEKGFEITLRQA